MDSWNQFADKLEAVLTESTPEHKLLFINNATPQQMADIAHKSGFEPQSKAFSSAIAVLAARLEEQIAGTALPD